MKQGMKTPTSCTAVLAGGKPRVDLHQSRAFPPRVPGVRVPDPSRSARSAIHLYTIFLLLLARPHCPFLLTQQIVASHHAMRQPQHDAFDASQPDSDAPATTRISNATRADYASTNAEFEGGWYGPWTLRAPPL